MFSCVEFIYENSFLEYLWKERVGCALTYAIFTSVGGGRRKIARKTFRRFPREMGGMASFYYLFIGGLVKVQHLSYLFYL